MQISDIKSAKNILALAQMYSVIYFKNMNESTEERKKHIERNITQSINQSINQSIHQSISQSINQSITRRTSCQFHQNGSPEHQINPKTSISSSHLPSTPSTPPQEPRQLSAYHDQWRRRGPGKPSKASQRFGFWAVFSTGLKEEKLGRWKVGGVCPVQKFCGWEKNRRKFGWTTKTKEDKVALLLAGRLSTLEQDR